MSREKYEKLLKEEQKKAEIIKESELKRKMDLLHLYSVEYYDQVGNKVDYPYHEYNSKKGGMLRYKHKYEDVSEAEVNELYDLVQHNKYKNQYKDSQTSGNSTSGIAIIGYAIIIIGFVLSFFSPPAAILIIPGSLLLGAIYIALGRIISDVNELTRPNKLKQ